MTYSMDSISTYSIHEIFSLRSIREADEEYMNEYYGGEAYSLMTSSVDKLTVGISPGIQSNSTLSVTLEPFPSLASP